MAYTEGSLRPKGVSFSAFKYIKLYGFHLFEVYGLGIMSFRSIKVIITKTSVMLPLVIGIDNALDLLRRGFHLFHK